MVYITQYFFVVVIISELVVTKKKVIKFESNKKLKTRLTFFSSMCMLYKVLYIFVIV